MAHEIYSSDAVIMVREPAWHRLGIVLPNNITAMEALQMVAPWSVVQEDIMTVTGYPITGFKANIRADNREVLGIVSTDYTVAQNQEIFEFMAALVGAGACIETAGTLRGGRKIWVMAHTRDLEVVPGDPVRQNIYVTTGHDGLTSLEAAYTDWRIICANTLAGAQQGNRTCPRVFRARHTGSIKERITEARQVLGLADRAAEESLETYQQLAKTYPTEEEVQQVLEALFPEREDAKRDTWSNKREEVKKMYESGETCNALPEIEGTAWSLFNAATEYNQYYQHRNFTEERSWLYTSEGAGGDFHEEALQQCLLLVR